MIKIRDIKGERILKGKCGHEDITLIKSKKLSMEPPIGMFQLVIYYECSECAKTDKLSITKAELL